MKEAGLTEVGKSILNRQNTVAQYIATRPLLDLCEGAYHYKLNFEHKQEDHQVQLNRETMPTLEFAALLELYMGFIRILQQPGMRSWRL